MTTTLSRKPAWLRPGQRLHTMNGPDLTGDELIVARLIQDQMGLTHAILRESSSGREVRMYADQIQFAIEAGMLSPLETVMASPAC